jgi:hypothetical protein
MQRLEARHHALMSLAHCAQQIQGRDGLIREAAAAGISKAEIGRIMGLSRQHVSVIVNHPGVIGTMDALTTG